MLLSIGSEAWLTRSDGATAYIKREDKRLFFCAYHGAKMPTGGQVTCRWHSESEAITYLTDRIGITSDDVWHIGKGTALGA